MFIRVTNSIPMWGCGVSKDTEACITRRIEEALAFRQEQYENAESVEEKKRIKKAIRNLTILLKTGFAYRATISHWIDDDPIYRERLGCLEDIKEPMLM